MALGKLKCDTIENEGGSSITVASLVTLDTAKANLSGATFTGDVIMNAQNDLKFRGSSGTNFIGLQAPGTVSTSSTWTLPGDTPSADQYLKVTSVSSNNPTLEWADVSAGVTWTNTITFDGDDSWTGIPAGVTELFFTLADTFSDGQIALQLGNSGGFVTSGYTNRTQHVTSSAVNTFQNRTDSMKIAYGEGHFHIGHVRLSKRTDSNDWIMTSQTMMTDGGGTQYRDAGFGKVNSGGTLDRVRVYRTAGSQASGTITFGYA